MSDLIRRQDALDAIHSDIKEIDSFDIDYGIKKASIRRSELRISQVQQVDAVEIVRCKDCKHLGENDGYYFCNAIGISFGDKPNWFCADGKRKEQNDE